MADEVWQLRRGGTRVAEIVVTELDQPWLSGHLRAVAPAFDELRPVFAEELAAVEAIDDDLPRWEAAYGRIRAELELLGPGGEPIAEFLLHVDGEAAWFRYSEEPFDEDE